ncbi:CD209 antigen-like [Xyrichtys novacula]|nr:CD209 antigen-like [Xyrichtys novacula]
MEEKDMAEECCASNGENGQIQLLPEESKLQYSVHAVRQNPLRVATVCLGLLCLSLLVGIIAQSVQHRKVEEDHQNKLLAGLTEKEDLQMKLKTEQIKKQVLQNRQNEIKEQTLYMSKETNQLQAENNQLDADSLKLRLSQSQLQASHTSLTKEVEQLRTSRDQLQANNNALASDKDLLQKQHDIVLRRKNDLHARVDTVTKERDALLSKTNNVSKSRDELQTDYNNLVRAINHLEGSYNSTLDDKGKIESSHRNLTGEKSLLLEATEAHKKSVAELEKAYGTYQNEQRDLKATCDIEVQARETLKKKNMNLITEREQLKIDLNGLNKTIEAKKCPNGWRGFENSCYFVSVLKKDWNQAREFCRAMSADLATVKTQETMNFVNGFYPADQEVWIGLTDDGVEGQWKWVDGTPLNTTFWAAGQPNSHKGTDQDCVEFWHRSSGNGEWNDENCSLVQNFICEV